MDASQTAADRPLADEEHSIPPRLAEAQENLARINETALEFVRARPVTCVVGAVALGFLIGKIAARY